MNINSEKFDQHYLINLDGDLDASSCLLLDQAIATGLEKGEKKILINCQKLNYISSAGLGVFMSYIQEFENNNTDMVIYGLKDKVSNVFQILGLDQLLKIVNTQEEAIEIIRL